MNDFLVGRWCNRASVGREEGKGQICEFDCKIPGPGTPNGTKWVSLLNFIITKIQFQVQNN